MSAKTVEKVEKTVKKSVLSFEIPAPEAELIRGIPDHSVKYAVATPEVCPGDLQQNGNAIAKLMDLATEQKVDFLLCSDLPVTGCEIGDVQRQDAIESSAWRILDQLAFKSKKLKLQTYLTLPLYSGGELYKAMVVLKQGKVTSFPCTLLHAREQRLFKCFSPEKSKNTPQIKGFKPEFVVIKPDFIAFRPEPDLFLISEARPEFALDYAEIKKLLLAFSAAQKATVLYAATGKGESTGKYVYAGHRFIAQNGKLLTEAPVYTTGLQAAEVKVSGAKLPYCVNPEKIDSDFPLTENCKNSFDFAATEKFGSLQSLRFYENSGFGGVKSHVSMHPQKPFLPLVDTDDYLWQTLEIAARGIAARLAKLNAKAVLGLSGGVDSTLALILTLRAFDILQKPRRNLIAVSLPCFGTSESSHDLGKILGTSSGADYRVISIKASVTQHLQDIGHDLKTMDTTFENAQARERTQVLMDLANMTGGIVIGSGDLSEIALGFCTYNGDQMSMYNANHAISKTLAQKLLCCVAESLLTTSAMIPAAGEKFLQGFRSTMKEKSLKSFADSIETVLKRPISPELLPPDANDQITQRTEEIVGAYELVDFLLYHHIFLTKPPLMTYYAAVQSFAGKYEKTVILKTLENFIRRFYRSQFKRIAAPEGVAATPFSLAVHNYSIPGDFCSKTIFDNLKLLEM